MARFLPGERVPQSGIYRVLHNSHRLMHESALRAEEIFPCCKHCGRHVRFELIRAARDQDVLPFRAGEILQECQAIAKAHKQAG